uniref:(northern house mosquito) hypothetical protein n=1 Tax=Culex pipiens TaxID=7175 RepID=A0A8D8J656_CULPI
MAYRVRDERVRAVQVPVHHAHQDQAVQRVAQPGDVRRGAAAPLLCGVVPLCGGPMRHLVAVCADRAGRRRGAAWPHWVALLDEAGRGDGGADRRRRLHVHPVQAVLEPV